MPSLSNAIDLIFDKDVRVVLVNGQKGIGKSELLRQVAVFLKVRRPNCFKDGIMFLEKNTTDSLFAEFLKYLDIEIYSMEQQSEEDATIEALDGCHALIIID